METKEKICNSFNFSVFYHKIRVRAWVCTPTFTEKSESESSSMKVRLLVGRATDPHHLIAEPDLAFHFNADPDPAVHFK
jgi:hypothetical protein